jgi:hypothetical protein
LPVQAEAGKAFSNGSFFWPIFWYTVGISTVIMAVVSAVKAFIRPQLPRRWLKTFLLSQLTWFGSLWLLYSIGNSGNHERATIDFWSFATFFIAPLLTLIVAVLVAFGGPAKPADPLEPPD